MNNENVHQNVGASQEAVAQNNNKTTFAEKAKKVAGKVKKAAGKAAFPVIATAVTVSTVACAAYRVIELVRLIKGDEK